MQAKPMCLMALSLGQRQLGEDLVAMPPHRSHAEERRSVIETELGDVVVEVLDVHLDRALGRPRPPGERRRVLPHGRRRVAHRLSGGASTPLA